MEIISGEQLGQKQWNEFVSANSQDAGFLQSWQWGEFQKKAQGPRPKAQSKSVFRLAVLDDNDDILAVAQIIEKPLPLGRSYFYIPRGPIVKKDLLSSRATTPQAEERGDPAGLLRPPPRTRNDSVLEFLFSEIKKLSQKEKAIFIRFDPAWRSRHPVGFADASPLTGGDLSEVGQSGNVGVLPPPLNLPLGQGEKIIPVGQVQPWQTLILDISKSEDELASQMKPKTRYNIKVAQRHCVKIDEGDKYLEDFIRLTKQTSERDQFVSHPDDYYRRMLETLAADGTMKLFAALDGGKVVAANLAVFFGEWCVYLHGASDYDYRDKMAPYLLQWEIVQWAKSRDKKYYDFWGVDEAKWPGVTRFKRGFAPEQEFTKYAGCFDLPVDRIMYSMYRLAKGKK